MLKWEANKSSLNKHVYFYSKIIIIIIIITDSTRIWDSPSSGQIRLTGSEYSNIGLLEIYCNGEWGTVCDDGFYGTEARVACRQLGYNDYYDYDSASMWELTCL